MKVLRKSDRVKFEVDGVKVTVAPLSYRGRIEVSSHTKVIAGETIADYTEQTYLMLKKCLKGVDGLKDFSGKDYELEFDGDELTADCAEEILETFKSSSIISPVVRASLGNLENQDGVEMTVLGK